MCEDLECVMTEVFNSENPPTNWSSCSISALQSSLSREVKNLGRCLGNEPTTTVGDPVCGNCIQEGEEACDCGNSEVRLEY